MKVEFYLTKWCDPVSPLDVSGIAKIACMRIGVDEHLPTEKEFNGYVLLVSDDTIGNEKWVGESKAIRIYSTLLTLLKKMFEAGAITQPQHKLICMNAVLIRDILMKEGYYQHNE